LPVGLTSVSIPGLVSPSALVPSHPFFSPCGQGPPLSLNGVSIPTAVVGTVGDLLYFRPVRFIACLPKTGLSLSAGKNDFFALSGHSAFAVMSVAIQSNATKSQVQAPGRSVRIENWGADSRTVSVGRGAASVLAIAQNFNPGWHATLGNVALTPIRLDGWQQGFEVPAGAGGTIAMVMTPDETFRLSLLLGLIFLVVLGALAILSGRRQNLDPCRARTLPAFWILLIASAVVLFVVAGPLALVVLPLFIIARRGDTRWMALTAFVAFSVAGIAAALHPASSTASGAGAFEAPAQAASIVALAAVLASLAVGRGSQDSSDFDQLEVVAPD